MNLHGWLWTTAGRIISGAFWLGIGIALIVGVLWATNVLGWRAWRLQEVQQFIGAERPVEARDIQFATNNAKTRIVWLRFTLPAEADLSEFLSQMGIDRALREGFTPFPAPNPIEVGITWWRPQAAQTYSGVYAIRDNKMVEFLLDQTDTANPVVYLRVYALGMN